MGNLFSRSSAPVKGSLQASGSAPVSEKRAPAAADTFTKEKKTPEKVVKRIAIIGGGCAGVAALKIIAEMPQFKSGAWQVTLYERRDDLGGVWHAGPATDNPPQTPLYDSCRTNVPHPMMAYEDNPFPPSTPLYPSAARFQAYVASVVTELGLTPHVRLNISATSIEPTPKAKHAWHVEFSTGESGDFDHVVVAIGHYTIPRLPETPGLAGWVASARAQHSAWYRRPDSDPARAHDTVLIVGNGASARDITEDLRLAGTRTIIRSIRGAERTDEDGGKLKTRGVVADYRPDGSVLFEDGTVERGIDFAWVATGFQAQYPFFRTPFLLRGLPPRPPPLADTLYDSSYHLFPLARYTFPLAAGCAPASLAFIGLPMFTALNPFFEAQARAMVRVFAEPDALDPAREAEEIVARVERIIAERLGGGPNVDAHALAKEWFRLFPNEGLQYRDEVNAWAASVVPSGNRKVPDWVYWAGERILVIREQWRELEREGLADEWVRGVGEGGVHEWVELMEKLVKRAEEKGVANIGMGSPIPT